MNFLSVCSGIEAASVAWSSLGWKACAFSEIEPFPIAVLKHRHPDVPNLGSMTSFKHWIFDGAIDLLCGGTPCQSFSAAGLRKGLDDPRGNLMLTFGAIAAKFRPQWLVWENVPGVLSSNGGRDFGSFLGLLAQCGYGFAYRVLDAQHFGVPQRRRRVFVVGYLGSWRRAAAVLFERHSLSGHPAPGKEARPEIAGTLSARACAGGGLGAYLECAGGLIPRTSHTLAAHGGHRQDPTAETLIAFHGSQDPDVSGDVTHPLGRKQGQEVCIAIAGNHIGRSATAGGNGAGIFVDITPTLTTVDRHAVAFDATQITSPDNRSNPQPAIATPWAVRRLTPKECERLQGFPDDYTAIPWRGKSVSECPDSLRYRSLGNSWAVPVARWIGERIQLVERIAA